MKKFVLLFTLLLLAIPVSTNAEVYNYREITDSKKAWVISLSDSVNVNSVKETTVYIKNTETGKKIKVEYFFNKNKDKITVVPVEGYDHNIGYELVVKNLKSSKGKKIKDSASLTFEYVRTEKMPSEIPWYLFSLVGEGGYYEN